MNDYGTLKAELNKIIDEKDARIAEEDSID